MVQDRKVDKHKPPSRGGLIFNEHLLTFIIFHKNDKIENVLNLSKSILNQLELNRNQSNNESINICMHKWIINQTIFEFFYQRSVVELSQVRHLSPPIELVDVDVVDVAAAVFFIVYTLVFDTHIYLYLYILSDLIWESKAPI